MVIFITGKKHSGKTMYAKKIMNHWWFRLWNDSVLLDGDNVREYFPTGFSDKEREEHIMRIAKFAALLEEQGKIVIIALVSPRKKWRQEARKLFKRSELVYITGGYLWPGTTYEEPDNDEKPLTILRGNHKYEKDI
jgi:adenylylsulfate kinase